MAGLQSGIIDVCPGYDVLPVLLTLFSQPRLCTVLHRYALRQLSCCMSS
jgi:hypothetical protein